MHRAAWSLVFLAMLPGLGLAQSLDQPRGQAYVFFAPGFTSPGTAATVHFGGGGEGFVYKGLGVGGEIGYVAPWRSLSDGLGVFSANGSYHFLPRDSGRKVVPFSTSGYTLFFRSGTAHGFNFGAGANY